MPSQNHIDFLVEKLDTKRLTRIVEVGANPLGTPPHEELVKLDVCEVWGFEPQEQPFKDLVKNASKNEKYLPYTIGDRTKKALNLKKALALTSTLEPNRRRSIFSDNGFRLACN